MNTQPSTSPAFIGIDIGGTKTLGVAVNENGDLLDERRVPTPKGAAELIATASSIYFQLSENVVQTSPDRFEVQSLGIGIAGLVDIDGQLRRAPNLVEVDGLDMGPILETKLGVPVCIDNDVNCAALAELSDGAAASVKNSLLVTLGTGIGGALIVDGGIHEVPRNGRRTWPYDRNPQVFMCLRKARLLGSLRICCWAQNRRDSKKRALQQINDKVEPQQDCE